MCKMIICPGVFFIFSKFWFSGLLGGQGGWGGKRPKIAQNDNTLCLSHSICQEPYIIWSPFVVHKWKIIISPEFFFIFSKFWFFWLLGGWKGKKWSIMIKNFVFCTLYLRSHRSFIWPKMTKKYFYCTPYLSNHTSFYCVFCCSSLKWWHLHMLFSFFQNFSFLHFKDGGKCKIWSKMAIQICLTLYLRNCTSYDCGFWYTDVKCWYLQQFLFLYFF